MPEPSLSQLVKDTAHYDKDNRYMATNDIISYLEHLDHRATSGTTLELSVSKQHEVCKAVLKQLDDTSSDVQSIAIKCLSLLVQKVESKEVYRICDTLCSALVANPDATIGENGLRSAMQRSNAKENGNRRNISEIRDIYGIGLRNALKNLSQSLGADVSMRICHTIIPHMLLCLQRQHQLDSILHDILSDVVNTFIQCYPEKELKKVVDFYTATLFTYLEQLQREGVEPHRGNELVIKKVIDSLAEVTKFMDDATTSELISHLLSVLNMALQSPTSSPSDTTASSVVIETIGKISKRSGSKLVLFLDQILPIFIANLSSDQTSSELKEDIFVALTSFVEQIPKQMKALDSEILHTIVARTLDAISYDPNYNYDDNDKMLLDYHASSPEVMEVEAEDTTGNGMQEDDEEEDFDDDYEDEDDDDDDTSWKVRRSAAVFLQSFISQVLCNCQNDTGGLVSEIYAMLLERRQEREETVRCEVFAALGLLFRSKLVTPGCQAKEATSSIRYLLQVCFTTLKEKQQDKNCIGSQTKILGLLCKLFDLISEEGGTMTASVCEIFKFVSAVTAFWLHDEPSNQFGVLLPSQGQEQATYFIAAIEMYTVYVQLAIKAFKTDTNVLFGNILELGARCLETGNLQLQKRCLTLYNNIFQGIETCDTLKALESMRYLVKEGVLDEEVLYSFGSAAVSAIVRFLHCNVYGEEEQSILLFLLDYLRKRVLNNISVLKAGMDLELLENLYKRIVCVPRTPSEKKFGSLQTDLLKQMLAVDVFHKLLQYAISQDQKNAKQSIGTLKAYIEALVYYADLNLRSGGELEEMIVKAEKTISLLLGGDVDATVGLSIFITCCNFPLLHGRSKLPMSQEVETVLCNDLLMTQYRYLLKKVSKSTHGETLHYRSALQLTLTYIRHIHQSDERKACGQTLFKDYVEPTLQALEANSFDALKSNHLASLIDLEAGISEANYHQFALLGKVLRVLVENLSDSQTVLESIAKALQSRLQSVQSMEGNDIRAVAIILQTFILGAAVSSTNDFGVQLFVPALKQTNEEEHLSWRQYLKQAVVDSLGHSIAGMTEAKVSTVFADLSEIGAREYFLVLKQFAAEKVLSLSETESPWSPQFLLQHSLKYLGKLSEKLSFEAAAAYSIFLFAWPCVVVQFLAALARDYTTQKPIVLTVLTALKLSSSHTEYDTWRQLVETASPTSRTTSFPAYADVLDPICNSFTGLFQVYRQNKDDLSIKVASLLCYQTVIHNYPALLKSYPAVQDELQRFLPDLYEATVVREELKRKVDFGPFKQTVDDGLPIRKAAFSLLKTILEAEPGGERNAGSIIDLTVFRAYLLSGLKDDADVQIICHELVSVLLRSRESFLSSSEDFLRLMAASYSKYKTKKTKDATSVTTSIKSVLNFVFTLNKDAALPFVEPILRAV